MKNSLLMLYNFYLTLIHSDELSLEARAVIHTLFTKFKRENFDYKGVFND